MNKIIILGAGLLVMFMLSTGIVLPFILNSSILPFWIIILMGTGYMTLTLLSVLFLIKRICEDKKIKS